MEPTRLEHLITFLVQYCSARDIPLGRTKLVKLLFLIDREAKRQIGRTVTNVTYRYHAYGPYADDIIRSLQLLDGQEVKEGRYLTDYGPGYAFQYETGPTPRFEVKLEERESAIADLVLAKYARKDLPQLLAHVYGLPEMVRARPLQVVLN